MHVGILCRRSLSVSALAFLFNPCSSSSYTTAIYYIYVVSITKRAHALTFKIAKYSFAGYFMLYFRQSKKNVTWFNLYKGLINIETKTTVFWNFARTKLVPNQLMYSNSTKTHGYLAKLFRISNIYHSDIHCMYMPLYLYIQNINDKIKKKSVPKWC